MQKRQFIIVSGPYFRYKSRDSLLVNAFLRISSVGVRPVGRKVWRRVKRTSVGICRRDWVSVKSEGVVKVGKVLTRKAREVMKRIVRARDTFGGTGRTMRPWA